MIEHRLQQISELEDNWDGYGASKPSPKVVEAVRQFIQQLPEKYRTKIDHEEVVPSPYGTISIEWNQGAFFVSMEIGENCAGFYSMLENGTDPYNDRLDFPFVTLPEDFCSALDTLLELN